MTHLRNCLLSRFFIWVQIITPTLLIIQPVDSFDDIISDGNEIEFIGVQTFNGFRNLKVPWLVRNKCIDETPLAPLFLINNCEYCNNSDSRADSLICEMNIFIEESFVKIESQSEKISSLEIDLQASEIAKNVLESQILFFTKFLQNNYNKICLTKYACKWKTISL